MVGSVVVREELVVKVKDGVGSPLFLCHGDFDGWGFYAFRLAEFLKYPGPVFLIHSNLDEAAGIDTIEEMAWRYLPHMLVAWPSGPFRLAGYWPGRLGDRPSARGGWSRGREDCDDRQYLDQRARPDTRRGRALSAMVRLTSSGTALHDRGMLSLWAVTRRVLRRDRAILMRAVRKLSQRSTVGPSRQSSYYRAMSKHLPRRSTATWFVC